MRFNFSSVKIHLRDIILKFIFIFQKKHKYSLFFWPNRNGAEDHHDIIRYHSDNVLCMVHYIISCAKYNNYHIYLGVYEMNKVSDYAEYCKALNPNITVCFFDANSYWSTLYHASKCSKCFTATGATAIEYKTKRQEVVCLNYFTPFKSDYVYDSKIRKQRSRINNKFDYWLTTAEIPARIMALDKGYPLEKFLCLGLCRNDVFYSTTERIKEKLSEVIGRKIDKIIVFAPAYRDYEINESGERDLFGYDDLNYDDLNSVLKATNSVIIAKMHSMQRKCIRGTSFGEYILNYHDLQGIDFSLYQYLSVADGLISDYTSTYYDFLHRNKPVIFNFYDLGRYKKTRGFSLNPIEYFCAGEIVNNSRDFVKAIEDVLHGGDKYMNKRNEQKVLFDNHYDGNNTKRVVDYFLKE